MTAAASSVPLDRVNTRAIDRTGGTVLHTSRTNPSLDGPQRPAGAPRSRRGSPRWRPMTAATTSRRWCSRTSSGSRSTPWSSSAATTRSATRRGWAREGVSAGRHPEDDGQRRPRHRVLHRLLDRRHPGQGAHQPPAHHARQPRAHRRLPHLRPKCRLHGLVRRLRHQRALRHPRGAVRPRRARPSSWPTTGA